ncbi:RmlC-like cupin domain-containing protein [Rhodotorula diobovata]|uniref:RmlC-like cupin domain-containing protein n=1 Tax=Rhodotorula diobovata TaxID=5288 RepID=A0A5C5FWE6_9BASI|nr:RmlC-like cupin domain-containing protein [Rhodotorula diobovata]
MPPYAYPQGNACLKRTLNLQPHPEGGFFAQTHAMDETVPSPFADGAQRQLATQIYYLLAASSSSSPSSSYRGKLHLNKSTTYHLLHQGRARYTLVRPTTDGTKPQVRHVVMGEDAGRGELRQLVVEGGWWKASEVPDEDLREARAEEGDKGLDATGCLISEVVVPGFSFDDHEFLTRKGLVELFGGDEHAPEVQQLLPYVQEDK